MERVGRVCHRSTAGNTLMETEMRNDNGFTAHDRSLPFVGPEAIDAACLACFDYEYADKAHGRDMEIVIETEEFTSVCPFSGLPDFAQVVISYVPDKECLELRSLKYYLLSYRNVGIWYEHLANRMLEDLVAACRPQRMTVNLVCNARGGLTSTLTVAYEAHKDASQPDAQ